MDVDVVTDAVADAVVIVVAAVVAATVHGGVILVEETIGAKIGAAIGTLVLTNGAGLTGKVLMMVIEWDLRTEDGMGVLIHGQTKMQRSGYRIAGPA